jgi:dihydroxyacid dehydratase/phosphogluconate dehydratase
MLGGPWEPTARAAVDGNLALLCDGDTIEIDAN